MADLISGHCFKKQAFANTNIKGRIWKARAFGTAVYLRYFISLSVSLGPTPLNMRFELCQTWKAIIEKISVSKKAKTLKSKVKPQ